MKDCVLLAPHYYVRKVKGHVMFIIMSANWAKSSSSIMFKCCVGVSMPRRMRMPLSNNASL